MFVIDAGCNIQTGAMDVAGRDSFIRALVEVIIIGQIYFRTFERLVVHSYSETHSPFASKLLELVSQLCVDVQRAVEALAFLIHHQAHADALRGNFDRHVGNAGKRLGRIVNANPLEPRSSPYPYKIGKTDGRRIIKRRSLIILRELGIGLCRTHSNRT